MKVSVTDIKGNKIEDLEVKFQIIENAKGTQATHEVVTAYRAAQRSGTACTKTAGEVAGTNKKPWKQKGTGRARAGSFQSPLWPGGGVVFGPKPRDFTKKVSKTTKRLALRKALGERLKAGDVLLVNELSLSSPKTKGFTGLLSDLNLSGSTLIVTHVVERNLQLASRNIPKTEVTTSDVLNPYQILRYDKLVFTKGAFEQVEQRLAK